ncbi:MAG TPA: phasin family protein [Burkholderiales bacterium]|jgi:phasin family protein|nr:phasin family protein [Burkholderiales bacterium]
MQMQPQFFEIYRAGLKSAADMMSASMQSVQRLQQQQLDVLQGAIDDQMKSVRELSDVKTIDELMALQTRFTGAQFERAVDFWSRMWRVAGDSQVAIIGQAQAQLGQVQSTIRDTTYQQQQEQRKHQERKTA